MNDNQTDFSRRQLLRTVLALGSGITLANTMSTSWLAGEEPRTKQDVVHGIAELHLHSTKVNALHRFYASEIGLVVDDVPKTVEAVNKHLGLDIYRDNSASFASIGDEHALLVVVKRNRKWFPARTRPAKVFPTVALIRNSQTHTLTMSDYDYKISTE